MSLTAAMIDRINRERGTQAPPTGGIDVRPVQQAGQMMKVGGVR